MTEAPLPPPPPPPTASTASTASAVVPQETTEAKARRKGRPVFPAKRIKRIMQTDEAVGKVSAATPIVISKCLELFLKDLVSAAAAKAHDKSARTITPAHLKECITKGGPFDFLSRIMSSVSTTSSTAAEETEPAAEHDDEDEDDENDDEDDDDDDDEEDRPAPKKKAKK